MNPGLTLTQGAPDKHQDNASLRPSLQKKGIHCHQMPGDAQTPYFKEMSHQAS
jgi:hypothetical protein